MLFHLSSPSLVFLENFQDAGVIHLENAQADQRFCFSLISHIKKRNFEFRKDLRNFFKRKKKFFDRQKKIFWVRVNQLFSLF